MERLGVKAQSMVIRLRDDGGCVAGGTLLGEVAVPREEVPDGAVMEILARWHTEGKGDEDSNILPAIKLMPQEPSPQDEKGDEVVYPFDVPIPPQPWSYEGKLLKIRWFVRARLTWQTGEAVAELPFRVISPALDGNAGSYRSPG